MVTGQQAGCVAGGRVDQFQSALSAIDNQYLHVLRVTTSVATQEACCRMRYMLLCDRCEPSSRRSFVLFCMSPTRLLAQPPTRTLSSRHLPSCWVFFIPRETGRQSSARSRSHVGWSCLRWAWHCASNGSSADTMLTKARSRSSIKSNQVVLG